MTILFLKIISKNKNGIQPFIKIIYNQRNFIKLF